MADSHIRDCYQQVKTVRRLLLILQDDLGDMTISRQLDSAKREAYGKLCDRVCEFEAELHKAQAWLEQESK